MVLMTPHTTTKALLEQGSGGWSREGGGRGSRGEPAGWNVPQASELAKLLNTVSM